MILNGRDAGKLARTMQEFASAGHRVDGQAFDVTSESAVTQGIAALTARVGPIDILVNNAGIHRRVMLAEMTLEDWDVVLRTNLTSAFLVTRAVVPAMIERQRGKIINVCSLMSELARPTIANYAAAKGGLKMLTRSMAIEWAKFNIQANGLGPGYMLTEMTAPLAADPKFDAWIKARTPAGRWGLPDEVIGATVFLASDASNFVNGQIIYVDGGLLAGV